MVEPLLIVAWTIPLWAVEQSSEPLIERLDPQRRVALVMALLGIAVLGLFLVVVVLLGGNWARRLARHTQGPTKDTTNVANRRLRETLKSILPADSTTDETTVLERGTDETVSD